LGKKTRPLPVLVPGPGLVARAGLAGANALRQSTAITSRAKPRHNRLVFIWFIVVSFSNH
jgi:hypothetical protein